MDVTPIVPGFEAAAELERLRVEVDLQRMRADSWADTADERAIENAELRAALIEAREDLNSWGAYASGYFQKKWDLAGDLARIDATIAKFTEAQS